MHAPASGRISDANTDVNWLPEPSFKSKSYNFLQKKLWFLKTILKQILIKINFVFSFFFERLSDVFGSDARHVKKKLAPTSATLEKNWFWTRFWTGSIGFELDFEQAQLVLNSFFELDFEQAQLVLNSFFEVHFCMHLVAYI